MIGERRTAHPNCWNAQRGANSFEIGDVVKYHIQVHSNIVKSIVGKLSYQGRDLLQIKEVFKASSYLVQRYNSPDGPTQKYKGSESYLLPLSIFLHNPVLFLCILIDLCK